MRIVRRISLGITTLPRSSILLTIPVAFIILTPLLLLRTCIVCRLREIMRINEKLNRMAEMYVPALKYYLYMEALMLTQTENKRSVVITHFLQYIPDFS
jgi:hypothetical protein